MADSLTRCPWWIAWLHRRNRRLDNAVTWTALRATGASRYPDDDEAALLFALKGWLIFIQQPEQHHWRCPCAGQDPELYAMHPERRSA